MNSIFFRIYLATVAFFVTIFYIFSFLVSEIVNTPVDMVAEEADLIFKLVEPQLKSSDSRAWPDIISTINNYQIYHQLKLQQASDIDENTLEQINEFGSAPMDSGTIYRQVYPLGNNQFVSIETEAEELGFLDEYGFFYVLVFLGLGFGYVLIIRSTTAPISQLTQAVNQFSQGDFSVRANENYPKPINGLARQFNRMASKISNQIKEQNIMMGAIPHELRTPLGHLRFALDLTADCTRIDEIRSYIELMDEHCDTMELAIAQTITFLKIQNSTELDMSCLDPKQITQSIVNSGGQSPVLISTNYNHSSSFQANEALASIAIRNVINNALFYAESQISIQTYNKNGEVHFVISDDGPGIPESSRSEVLLPFSKLCKSRSESENGIGLGLSMVQLIMFKHQGNIKIEDNSWNGTAVTLSFKQQRMAS